jgi:hypothetical protein
LVLKRVRKKKKKKTNLTSLPFPHQPARGPLSSPSPFLSAAAQLPTSGPRGPLHQRPHLLSLLPADRWDPPVSPVFFLRPASPSSSLAAPARHLPGTVSPSPRLLTAPRAAHQCATHRPSPFPFSLPPETSPHRAPPALMAPAAADLAHRLTVPFPLPPPPYKAPPRAPSPSAPPPHPLLACAAPPHRRAAGAPPRRPDPLLRRLSLPSELPSESPLLSSSFRRFPRRDWWPGDLVCLSSANFRWPCRRLPSRAGAWKSGRLRLTACKRPPPSD